MHQYFTTRFYFLFPIYRWKISIQTHINNQELWFMNFCSQPAWTDLSQAGDTPTDDGVPASPRLTCSQLDGISVLEILRTHEGLCQSITPNQLGFTCSYNLRLFANFPESPFAYPKNILVSHSDVRNVVWDTFV